MAGKVGLPGHGGELSRMRTPREDLEGLPWSRDEAVNQLEGKRAVQLGETRDVSLVEATRPSGVDVANLNCCGPIRCLGQSWKVEYFGGVTWAQRAQGAGLIVPS